MRTTNKLRALGLGAALVGWSLIAPRLPQRWHPLPHTVLGALAVAGARGRLGLRPPALWRGLRFGLAAALAAALGVAATTTHGRVRLAMADRELPPSAARWLLVGIPLGTVFAEETAYRGVLGTAATSGFGRTAGRLLQAVSFGLSHLADARRAGEPLLPTVLVTGLAGWVFGWLYDRSGSIVAPMLAHLAVNEAGAVAALIVQRGRVTD
ncbi:CAAX protease self-immunity family protein [Mycolicibacterium hassiacum DSM 44199]|jgi:hypothetical protein|uniref:CAAX protease self-immunity family protein n=2 Tax=Mycolicibacterium hassiacum TaxID=46351 RepID=K5BIZ8_MYCHD|nr:CPBP family intramembrane glutamic endopeptidase [Mycolicibacterium hassiacum]EKF22239.1 CAAX protease self-immunity family protein [Mycolicibacterium hassiacum DSM 44199]MDA4087489.1 abortive phage infection protein [Mycolicibacterium hassiacum DSM 44199]PZN21441.1 MAG: CPBP family intramembrane metalloprotease [Mycolicibacterium hassiacum]VCT91887.1 hypothetical protein MHAS_03610 [Mycolicibacterium hassiacum DSM 44199]